MINIIFYIIARIIDCEYSLEPYSVRPKSMFLSENKVKYHIFPSVKKVVKQDKFYIHLLT